MVYTPDWDYEDDGDDTPSDAWKELTEYDDDDEDKDTEDENEDK